MATESAEAAKATSQSEKKPNAGGGASLNIDQDTINKITETLSIPLQSKDDFWKLEAIINTGKSDKRFLGIFKKKVLSIDEINDLRKSAIQSPGNTRAKLARLKKQYPQDPVLYMLSAICTHGMLLNSSNRREVLNGLKIATKEAATALLSNGISVYNIDNFYRIYFTLLDRLKRNQVRTFGIVNQDPRLESYKSTLIVSMRVVDQLLTDKNRINNVLNFLKKKLKSKQYTQLFTFGMIRDAVRQVENGTPKEKVSGIPASEIIAYIYAMGVSFARTPVLWPVVEEITKILPDSVKPMLIRKISINSVRNFTRYKIATVESDREQMAKIGKTIVKENMVGVQKLEGQSLYQSYETDPFFNLAFIAELTVGLYKTDDHKRIIDTAIQAVDAVIKRDMSKNHIFTESASNHAHKLALLRDGGSGSDKRV